MRRHVVAVPGELRTLTLEAVIARTFAPHIAPFYHNHKIGAGVDRSPRSFRAQRALMLMTAVAIQLVSKLLDV